MTLPSVNWHFFNKAKQAIWAGDLTGAKRFLAETAKAFKESSYKETTGDLHGEHRVDPELRAKWDEIVREAVDRFYAKSGLRRAEVEPLDHISATLHACDYLMKMVENLLRAEKASKGEQRVVVRTEDKDVFLAAYSVDEARMLVKGYAPGEGFPDVSHVRERLSNLRQHERPEGGREIDFELGDGWCHVLCMVHAVHYGYIGSANIFFAPWSLVTGWVFYGRLDGKHGLDNAARDFLLFLGNVLAR